MTNSKRKTVDTAPWPRGVFEVTEAEYAAAKADESQDAWQVVRCCNGWPSVAGMVKKWLVKYRPKNSADLSTDAKLAALRAGLS